MTDLKNLSKVDVVILALSAILIFLALFYPSQSSIIATVTSNNLIPVIHTKYNAYFYLTSLGLWASSGAGLGILMVFGLLGLTAVLSYHLVTPIFAFAFSTTVYAIILGLFGHDFIILAPLSALPWLYLVICTANFANPSFLVLLSATSVILWLLLYALSIPTLLMAALLYFVFNQRAMLATTTIILFLCTVALVVLVQFSPPLPWPDYPLDSRVTELMHLPFGIARPLLGQDLPYPTADRFSVISQYNFLLVPLAILVLLSGIFVRFRYIARRGWMGCAVLLVLVFLDFRLPEEFAQISPLQSLARLLPDLSLIELAPSALSLVVVGLTLIILLCRMRSDAGALVSLVFAFCVILNSRSLASDKISDATPDKWAKSPSRYVTSYFTPEVLANAQSSWHAVRTKTQNVKVISSSSTPIDSKILLDKNLETRWSPGNSKQNGSEWLMFEFVNIQKIIGIQLKTGAYVTDFPRGIVVKAGKDCSESALEKVTEFKNWQGSPKFTPNGYPYFSAQSEVQIFFPKEIEISCLKVEQTGRSDQFDWSVAEFRVMKRD